MPRKVYIEVNIKVDAEGNTNPLSFVWEDGEVYEIDRLLHVGRQATTKIGGSGICYTVMVCGRETKMWEDEGKWFMEAKR
ncbi:MAG: hypothetical protein LBQ48_06620 [Oscillospiraceae bacterium]|jgi:hypothetical protein|nr:hypothetical protein [Oscillospiraceae bacterium]